jgi:hypothetical protein
MRARSVGTLRTGGDVASQSLLCVCTDTHAYVCVSCVRPNYT